MGFEIIESSQGTITDQTDEAGISRDFIVYKMGTLGASASSTFTLVNGGS